MNLLGIIISTRIIQALGWTILHSIWQGSLVFILASLLLWLFRKHSSAFKYAVLCISLIVILGASVTTFLIASKDNHSSAPGVLTIDPAVSMLSLDPASQNFRNGTLLFTRPYLDRLNAFIESNGNYLVLFWFIGFMFFMARYLGGLSYIHQLKKRGTNPISEQWKNKAVVLAIRSGIRKKLTILESIHVHIPVTIGHIKPFILLPLGMMGSLPPEQVEAILMHEMAHIFRKDYLVNLLQSIMEAIFFYHPAVWWISQKLRSERENICDDIAVRQTKDPLTYIKALTTMEELNSKPLELAPCHGQSIPVESRVKIRSVDVSRLQN